MSFIWLKSTDTENFPGLTRAWDDALGDIVQRLGRLPLMACEFDRNGQRIFVVEFPDRREPFVHTHGTAHFPSDASYAAQKIVKRINEGLLPTGNNVHYGQTNDREEAFRPMSP